MEKTKGMSWVRDRVSCGEGDRLLVKFWVHEKPLKERFIWSLEEKLSWSYPFCSRRHWMVTDARGVDDIAYGASLEGEGQWPGTGPGEALVIQRGDRISQTPKGDWGRVSWGKGKRDITEAKGEDCFKVGEWLSKCGWEAGKPTNNRSENSGMKSSEIKRECKYPLPLFYFKNLFIF